MGKLGTGVKDKAAAITKSMYPAAVLGQILGSK